MTYTWLKVPLPNGKTYRCVKELAVAIDEVRKDILINKSAYKEAMDRYGLIIKHLVAKGLIEFSYEDWCYYISSEEFPITQENMEEYIRVFCLDPTNANFIFEQEFFDNHDKPLPGWDRDLLETENLRRGYVDAYVGKYLDMKEHFVDRIIDVLNTPDATKPSTIVSHIKKIQSCVDGVFDYECLDLFFKKTKGVLPLLSDYKVKAVVNRLYFNLAGTNHILDRDVSLVLPYKANCSFMQYLADINYVERYQNDPKRRRVDL